MSTRENGKTVRSELWEVINYVSCLCKQEAAVKSLIVPICREVGRNNSKGLWCMSDNRQNIWKGSKQRNEGSLQNTARKERARKPQRNVMTD
jgi:hypothetical protein